MDRTRRPGGMSCGGLREGFREAKKEGERASKEEKRDFMGSRNKKNI